MFPKDYSVLLVVIGVATLLFWPLFSLLHQRRWKSFVYALHLYDPGMYADLGAPKLSFLQKLGDRNPLANDRLLYQVLRNPTLFDAHPGVKLAAASFRICLFVELIFTTSALILIALGMLLSKTR
jgi:hypothetical protein